MAGRLAEQVAQATPPERYRYVDLLRVAALGAVVAGHWMVPVFVPADGELSVRFVVDEQPGTRWATWVFQVMPVFFIVGGYANAAAWARAHDDGETAVAWASRRARRLLRPLVPLVVVWVVIVAAGQVAGFEARWLTLASQNALVPAWFLAVYVVVTVAVPITTRLDARAGLVAPLGLVVIAAGTDAATAVGFDEAQWTNFAWVWFAVHQLGIWWHRRGLVGPAGGAALLAGGLTGLYALVTLAGYPADMVTEVNGRTNATPPSIAMLALATAQLGAIAIGRRPIERMLDRPGAWAPVAIAGRRIMSIFLWHMTAMVAAATALNVAGALPLDEALRWGWWGSRPLWLATCAAVLAVIVLVVGRAERTSRDAPPSAAGPTSVAVGAAVVALAVGMLAAGGVHDPDGPLGLAVWPVFALVAALAALGVLDPDRPPPDGSD